MIISTGVDIIDIRRIEKILESFRDRFTPVERQVCDLRAERAAAYATRWATKEAVMKALGINDVKDGVAWREIEVLNTESGRPFIVYHGGAKRQLEAITPMAHSIITHVSCSDYFPFAVAFVTLEATKSESGAEAPPLIPDYFP